MLNKKGEGEQFNWIFVIVAGAIILGFFVMFTFKYIQLQEKRQDVDTVQFFGGKVLAASSRLQVGSGGAAVDSNEKEGIRFGYNVNLGYACVGNQSLILINKGETAYYNLDDEVVFMDKEIKLAALDGLDLWILPWNYPFHVTNFVYLASSKRNFILVYDSPSNRELVESLDITSAFKIDKVPENQLVVDRNTKVVYFTSSRPQAASLRALKNNVSDVDFVHINTQANTASFFNGREWSDYVKFYGLEQLFGAVFSNDAENFKCNVNKSLSRVKVVADIYAERATRLSQLDNRGECHYLEIANSLRGFSRNISVERQDIIKRQNLEGAGCVWVF